MITIGEMKVLEDRSEQLGVSKLQLMQNAGKGIFETLKEKFPDLKNKRVLIVAYHGNNGGDGFVAANYLADICEVNVLFLGNEAKLRQEGRKNYDLAVNNVKIQLFDIDFYEVDMLNFDDYDIIIDAIFGTGINDKIKEPISHVIDKINDSKAFKVAVDIPSGIDPDTGEVLDKAVNADLIITFHDIKKGMERFQDKTVIVDIGIPEKAQDVNN